MTSETWALLGVVIGAILGGAAQFVGDSIRHRRDTAVRIRSERREVYIEFIAASREGYGSLYKWRSLLEQGLPSDADRNSESDLTGAHQILNPAGDSLNRLVLAAAGVELVAPADTQSAATDVQMAVMWFMFKPADDELVKKLVDAQQKFAALAKRDLA